MDPVRDSWSALGRPVPDAPMTTEGQCARCGVIASPGARWQDVLSANFGDWDRLPFRTGILCGACSWAFGHKPFRLRPHLITPGSSREAGPEALRDVLSAPLARNVLVSVPIGRQKHLVPYGPYGAVVTDHGHLEWTEADASRLAVLAWLRDAGFGEAALAEQVPRWAILSKLGATDRATVMTLWPDLAPWRERTAYLDVACRATRRPKDNEETEDAADDG